LRRASGHLPTKIREIKWPRSGRSFRLRLPRTCGRALRCDLCVRVDWIHQGPGRLAGALLAIAQAWRAAAHSFARIPGCLSSRASLSQRHPVLRKLALQFSWRQFARLQTSPSWFRPNPLSTIAVLGLGANVQLHSTPVAVEVSVTHADHGRPGT